MNLKKWGAVALLPKEKKKFKNKKEWKKEYSKIKYIKELKQTHSNDETPSIFQNGFLAIRWPREITPENRLENIDYLIATVTKPNEYDPINDKINNFKKYPCEEQIAEAIKNKLKNNKIDDIYFFKNRLYGITTFQDKKILNENILKRLIKLKFC